jgi:hypothetical protein
MTSMLGWNLNQSNPTSKLSVENHEGDFCHPCQQLTKGLEICTFKIYTVY